MGTVTLELDQALEKSNFTLEELAERAEIKDAKLAKIKSGQISAIRLSTLAKICDVLECGPGDILKYSA